jgi:hypothetical protein
VIAFLSRHQKESEAICEEVLRKNRGRYDLCGKENNLGKSIK